MLRLSGFELYSRWVPLHNVRKIYHLLPHLFRPYFGKSGTPYLAVTFYSIYLVVFWEEGVGGGQK